MGVLDPVRDELGRQIRLTLAGTTETTPRLQAVADDPGLFGPGSATWAVHADPSMIIGGLRALLLQTLHPPTMAGVADHSNYRSDPLGRLHRTGRFLADTTFGTTDEALTAIAVVRSIHDRITGTTPDGVAYRANDPHLLNWVHCTEVDSFLRARMRYGTTPFDPAMADAYVAEMAEIARRLGVDDPPTRIDELKRTLWSYRAELKVGRQARDTVRFLALPPVAIAARPTYGIVFSAAVAMLPGFARRMLWLPVLPLAEPIAIRPAASAVLHTMQWALGEHPMAADLAAPTTPPHDPR
jgi:uncharacterized protein (DUF2236 family)